MRLYVWASVYMTNAMLTIIISQQDHMFQCGYCDGVTNYFLTRGTSFTPSDLSPYWHSPLLRINRLTSIRTLSNTPLPVEIEGTRTSYY